MEPAREGEAEPRPRRHGDVHSRMRPYAYLNARRLFVGRAQKRRERQHMLRDVCVRVHTHMALPYGPRIRHMQIPMPGMSRRRPSASRASTRPTAT